jgi:beta-glucosidase
MQKMNLWSSLARLTGFCAGTLGLLTAIPFSIAQTAQPWTDTSLPPEARAEMVLKQMTLDEKLTLLHGNGMAHASQW